MRLSIRTNVVVVVAVAVAAVVVKSVLERKNQFYHEHHVPVNYVVANTQCCNTSPLCCVGEGGNPPPQITNI